MYTLHVKATDSNTNESVTLKGQFRVFGHQEKYFCAVNFVNTGTQPLPMQGFVDYASVGNAKGFECYMDTKSTTCKFVYVELYLHYIIANASIKKRPLQKIHIVAFKHIIV